MAIKFNSDISIGDILKIMVALVAVAAFFFGGVLDIKDTIADQNAKHLVQETEIKHAKEDIAENKDDIDNLYDTKVDKE